MGAEAVLLLDDDKDILHALGDLIEQLISRPTVRAIGLDELQAKRVAALECSVAIIDINLGAGKPSGIDAVVWLRAEGYGGRVTFLTGHAMSHPTVVRACAVDGAQVLQKPIGVEQVRALIEK